MMFKMVWSEWDQIALRKINEHVSTLRCPAVRSQRPPFIMQLLFTAIAAVVGVSEPNAAECIMQSRNIPRKNCTSRTLNARGAIQSIEHWPVLA